VANKKFKVKQVCGRVTDLSGVPIPKVPIELQDEKSVPVRQAITDDDGVFTMSDSPKGEYILRVQYAGFASAWQPFVVTKRNSSGSCNNPMQVHLEFAGRCSGVSSFHKRH